MGKKIQYIGRYVMDGETLGKGNFARVELATHGVTGCKVAIKVIDTRKIKEDYVKQNLHREARILGQLRHPNIIRLYETLKATTLYCLVTEYAGGGELLAFIKMHPQTRLLEDKARPYVRQLVSAVHYLHERGVAHRDLKMENIMLDEKKSNIKIVDFGLSNTFTRDELMKTHCGSPEYAAPELFTAGEKYGPEIDIWSLGIIMYAMVVGKLPFTTPYTDQYRRQKLLQQIEKGLVDQHDREMSHLTSDCQDLIRKLIEPSPELRLPLMDIEIHPWLTLEAKLPFYPFQCLPKDKATKSQVVEELASLLDTDKAQLEKTVHECRCDEISAMFNMMLQRKRIEGGLFDIDHTQEQKVESRPRSRSRPRAKSAGRGHKTKGSVKHKASQGKNLNVPNAVTIEQPDTEGAEKHEHSATSASFDLLALCSTPSWLGPERRRSRRRSRAPPSSPTPYADVGATGTLANAVSGLGAAMAHGQENYKHKENHLNPDSANPSLSLTVPDRLPVPHKTDGSHHEDSRKGHGRLSRENSLKVPSRENSSKRIHHRHSDKRPSSVGPSVRRRASHLRKANSMDTDPELSVSISVTAPSPTPNSPKTTPKTEELRHSPIPRPVQLGLKECYTVNPKTTLTIKSSNVVPPPNGPQTAVQIQLSDYSNPCSITALEYDPESNSREALIKVDPSASSRDRHNNPGSGGHSGKVLRPAENPIQVECVTVKPPVVVDPVVRPKEKAFVLTDSPCVSRKTCVPPVPCVSPPGYHLPDDSLTSPYSSRLHSSFSSSSSDSLLESMQINKLASLCDKDTPEVSTLSTDLFSRAGSDDLAMLSPMSLNSRDFADGLTTTTTSKVDNQLFKDSHQDKLCNSGKLTMIKGNIMLEPANCAKVCNSTITTQNFSLCKNDNASVPCEPCPQTDVTKTSRNPSGERRKVVDSNSGRNSRGSNRSRNSHVGKHIKRNSMQSLQTPSTPTRPLLRTPIARVESFHSDDFDEYQTDDLPVLRTPTPQTPTVSKLPGLGQGVAKKSKESVLSKFSNRCGKEVSRVQGQDKLLRLEPGITESLLESAGSDVSERQEGSTEKLTTSNKIHPKEDGTSDGLKASGSKGTKSSKNKSQSHMGNTVTTENSKQAKQKQKTAPQKTQLLNAQESKKKPALKSSPWKRSFAHFLRKTKPCRNINNKDVTKDGDLINCQQQHSTNSNGHAHSPVSKSAPVCLHDNSEVEREHGWPLSLPAPVHNNIADAIEVTSPASFHEPTGTTVRLFDFTNVQPNVDSSPKSKSRFLSWRGCGECGRSDTSSEEGSDCAIRLEQLNTIQKPTSGANNIGEPRQSNVPSENVCC